MLQLATCLLLLLIRIPGFAMDKWSGQDIALESVVLELIFLDFGRE